MKSHFKVYFIFIFFMLNSCSTSLQNFIDTFNYSKNSVDVFSFVTTDKTTTDHALSYMFNKDCSLARTLQLKKICQEIKKENLVGIKELSNVNRIKKIHKKRVVKIKKINVPSMAY